MTKIFVNTPSGYDVYVKSGLLSQAGDLISSVTNSGKVAIISDSHVFPLYGKMLSDSLESSGFQICSYVFPSGEESKNGQTYLDILHFLSIHEITRSDAVIALGGGVVGDITGFAAATFLRGIPYIQIPTSLLAMVDSSVGGKTAIDLPAGKNLAGAFYQPKLVLCDPDTLSTLPESVFRDGCAEVIKYAILFDPELFSLLMDYGIDFPREDVISRCITWKRDIVVQDELDLGCRQLLNLGHTIGHAVEAHSHFSISHGQAVAIGTAAISLAAAKNCICTLETHHRICKILDRFQLPRTTEFSSHDLYQLILSDKKRSADKINLVLPKEIGSCIIQKTNLEDVRSLIEAGLSYEYNN